MSDFECGYPYCDCQHVCRATGRDVGRLRSGGDPQLGALTKHEHATNEPLPASEPVESIADAILQLARRPGFRSPMMLADHETYIETPGAPIVEYLDAAGARAAYDRTAIGQADALRREGRHLVARIVLALPGLARLARWLGGVA